MICKSCGAEIPTGKRFCSKCGTPLVDFSVRPKAEEADSVPEIGKRIIELKPVVKEIKDKEEKEKELEIERKRKEEEKRLAALRAACKLDADDDDEEILCVGEWNDDDESDYEEEEDEYEFDDDENHINEVPIASESIEDDDIISIEHLVNNKYKYIGATVKTHGNVYFSECDINAVFIMENESKEESLTCFVKLVDLDYVEYQEMLYSKNEIVDIVNNFKRGEHVVVEGFLDDKQFNVLSIEGDDFFIRCAE